MMKYLNVTSTDPYENLALEEYLLRRGGDEELFLLWQNVNTVVIGSYQNATEEVDTVYAAREGITLARRMTGGGAVYHDLGNVNFSWIAPCSDPGRLDFASFSARMVAALRAMGIDAQANGRNDLTVDGRKCSGSAQTVREHTVLHHGTLLFSTDLERMERVLTVSQEKLSTKGVASVRSRVTNLCEHTLLGLPAFRAGLLEQFGGQPLELTEEDRAAIAALRAKKYADPQWIFGRSPGYTVRKGRRFPGGRVDALLDVEKGNRIRALALQGDFFGSGEIGEVEQRLIGAQMTEDGLRKALTGLAVERYISGVDTDALVALLLA